MISEVNCYPQYLIEETIFNENYAVISITDSKFDRDGMAKIVGTNNILRLQFLDIEEPCENIEYTSFTEEMGQKVAEFINELHKTTKEIKLVIHCRMGASRSPALSLYVKALTGCEFPGEYLATKPNLLVIKTMEKISGLKIDIPEQNKDNDKIIFISKIKVN